MGATRARYAWAGSVIRYGSLGCEVWRERRVWSGTSACTGRRAICPALRFLGAAILTSFPMSRPSRILKTGLGLVLGGQISFGANAHADSLGTRSRRPSVGLLPLPNFASAQQSLKRLGVG